MIINRVNLPPANEDRREIYKIVRELTADGLGVVVVSSDVDELMQVCDRIVIMHHGRLIAERTSDSFDKEEITALCMTG